ncbi:MAG: DUF4224 domain-containing protein [Methylobacillus sp.]|jgi:hypothetical protein|nr:DUF4224 domain-containing protein [Methylobacillus sp.]
MRLSANRLQEITHRRRASGQVAWFRQKLGADVPFDKHGPILTETAYEKLLEKRLGILPSSETSEDRPRIRLKYEQA